MNSTRDISDNFFNLLIKLNHKLFDKHKMAKNHTMPPSHMKALFFIYHAHIHNEACTVSDVAEFLSISKPNMTPILDKLISEGLIHRYNDEHDRRKINIGVTKEGLNILESRKKEVKNDLLDKISTLTKEDVIKLDNLINDMSTILDKIK